MMTKIAHGFIYSGYMLFFDARFYILIDDSINFILKFVKIFR